EIAALVDGNFLRGFVHHQQKRGLLGEFPRGLVSIEGLPLRVNIVELARTFLRAGIVAHSNIRTNKRPVLEGFWPHQRAGSVELRERHRSRARGRRGWRLEEQGRQKSRNRKQKKCAHRSTSRNGRLRGNEES